MEDAIESQRFSFDFNLWIYVFVYCNSLYIQQNKQSFLSRVEFTNVEARIDMSIPRYHSSTSGNISIGPP